MKTIELPKSVQRRLAKLDALEAGGVDNWDGYDTSLEDYYNTLAIEEAAENLIEDIFAEAMLHIDQPAGIGCGYSVRTEGFDRAVKMLLARKDELTTEYYNN